LTFREVDHPTSVIASRKISQNIQSSSAAASSLTSLTNTSRPPLSLLGILAAKRITRKFLSTLADEKHQRRLSTFSRLWKIMNPNHSGYKEEEEEVEELELELEEEEEVVVVVVEEKEEVEEEGEKEEVEEEGEEEEEEVEVEEEEVEEKEEVEEEGEEEEEEERN
ncbi:hypothetical protein MS3_00011153, partial [Schistosoma haematobium]